MSRYNDVIVISSQLPLRTPEFSCSSYHTTIIIQTSLSQMHSVNRSNLVLSTSHLSDRQKHVPAIPRLSLLREYPKLTCGADHLTYEGIAPSFVKMPAQRQILRRRRRECERREELFVRWPKFCSQ